MEKNVKLTYSETRVLLDNQEFRDCTFDNCELEFSGTGPVVMDGCHFENPKFVFTGAAQNTLQFMRNLYHGLGKDGKDIIESTFRNIRKAQ